MKDPHRVKSTENVVRILECLKELDGAGVTDVADRVDISKSAVHNQLNTLRDHGFVRKRGTTYEVGLRFLEYGLYTRERSEVYRVGKPTIDKLANITGEVVTLIVREGTTAVYLYQVPGGEQPPPVPEGAHRALWNCTAGTAMLSCYSEAELEAIVDDEAVELDEETRSMIQLAREQDVIYDAEDTADAWYTVVTSITNVNGAPIGAIEVADPTQRMRGEKLEVEVPGLLMDAAKSIRNEFIRR